MARAPTDLAQPFYDCIPEVNRHKLDKKVDADHDGVQRHLGEIANAMDEWEGSVADALGLTKVDVANIRSQHRDSLTLQTRAALQKWQEKNGFLSTYRNLIVIFLKAGKTSYAEAVCKVLGADVIILEPTHKTDPHVMVTPAASTIMKPDQPALVLHGNEIDVPSNSSNEDLEVVQDVEPNSFAPNDLSVDGTSVSHMSDVESVQQDMVLNNLSDYDGPDTEGIHQVEFHEREDSVKRDNVSKDKNNETSNHGDEVGQAQVKANNNGDANGGASNVASGPVPSITQEFLGHDVVLAIEENSEDMLKALLASGANVTVPTQDTGTYAVHVAASSGHHDLMLLLLDKNVDANVKRKSDSRTPLHLACIEGDFQMVQMLVEKGANLSPQDDQGLTPLHFKETLESIEITEYLVHHGAPVDLPTKNEYSTPLMVCCRLGNEVFESACLLVTSGAAVDGHPLANSKPLIIASSDGWEPLVELLLLHRANINITDQNGNTPLLCACKNGHIAVARQLCKKNSNVDANLANKEGVCPLMMAVRADKAELVEIVLNSGADVNVTMMYVQTLVGGRKEEVMMTPLAGAAIRGNMEVIEKLVEYRAEVNITGQMRYSPISFACLNGHEQVVEFLLKLNDFDCSLNGISQPFKMAVQSNHFQCAELVANRFVGRLDGLFQTAIDHNMQDLIQCIEQFKQGPQVPNPVSLTPQLTLSLQQLEPPQPSPTPQSSTTAQSIPLNNFDQLLNIPHDNVGRQLDITAQLHIAPLTTRSDGEAVGPVSQTSMTGSLGLSEVQSHLDSLNNKQSTDDHKNGEDYEMNQFDSDDEEEEGGADSPPKSLASGSLVRAADNSDIGFRQSILNDVTTSGFDLSQTLSFESGSGIVPNQSVASGGGYHSGVASDSEASMSHRSLNQSAGVTEKHGENVTLVVPPQDQVAHQDTVVTPGAGGGQEEEEQEEVLNNFDETTPDEVEHVAPTVTSPMTFSSQSHQTQTFEATVTTASQMPVSSSWQTSIPAVSVTSIPPLTQQSQPSEASPSLFTEDSIHMSSLSQSQVPASHNGGPSSLSANVPGASLPEQQPSSAPWKMSDSPPLRATGPVMRTSSVEHDHTANGGNGSESQASSSNKPNNDLFEPRPKTPPPEVEPGHSDPSISLPSQLTPTLQSPPAGDLRHEMVEVLHEFTQICISASIRTRSQESLLEKVTAAGYNSVTSFFLQYFHNPAGLSEDGKLVTDFIGGTPSPIHFLISQSLLLRSDFECVLQEIGKKETFPDQLMNALHQFPGSENLPWSGEGIISGLFNGHFSFNSDSLTQRNLQNGSSQNDNMNTSEENGIRRELAELLARARSSPSPPLPKPYSGPLKKDPHAFPDSGGHRLGTADGSMSLKSPTPSEGSDNENINDDLEDSRRQSQEDPLLAAVAKAMSEKGILEHTLVHGLFAGPAGSGKSSLMSRLLGEMPEVQSPSTGVARSVVKVKVRKSTSIACAVSGQDSSSSSWLKLLYHEEAIATINFASQSSSSIPELGKTVDLSHTQPIAPANTVQESSSSVQSRNSSLPTTREATPPCLTPPCLAPPKGYVAPISLFRNSFCDKDFEELRQHFQSSWSLYLTDTGGQIEFQEVLPLLVSGSSIFFITFRLDRDLNQRYTIEFRFPDSSCSKSYESSLTVKEMILQILASVASMETATENCTQLSKSVQLKPKVFIVGTHKDLLDAATREARITEVDEYLQKTIKSTAHYREDLVEYSSESQLIYAVNNLSDDDSDFQEIRSGVEKVVQRNEYNMSFPSPWLIFGLVLRQQSIEDQIINYEESLAIAKDCGIGDEDELNSALQFLHKTIGLVCHFNVPCLKDVVIRDPQVIFDYVTQLIVQTFSFANVGKRRSEEFKKKGIFCFEDLLRGMQPHVTLSAEKFVEILKHLHIVAPFQTENGTTNYFMPCVLVHSKICQAIVTASSNTLVPPLLITFNCGYCPKGLAGALIVFLLTHEPKSKLKWILRTDQIFRDGVSFLSTPWDTITLCVHPTYLLILHSRVLEPASTNMVPIKNVCNCAREFVEEGLSHVTSNMKLTLGAHHSLSFYCQDENCIHGNGALHPADEVIRNPDGEPCTLKCTISGTITISRPPDGCLTWFGKECLLDLETERKISNTPDPSEFDQPFYTDCDERDVILNHNPKTNPSVDVNRLNTKVKLIFLTCNENEKWAVYEKLQPPILDGSDSPQPLERALYIPQNHTVIGTFAVYTVAVLSSEKGKKCERDLKNALDTFPNAQAIIGIGVAYGKDENTIKLGDVIVSDHIEDASQVSALQNSDGSVGITIGQRGRRMPIKNELLRYFKPNTMSWRHGNTFQVAKDGRISHAKVGTVVSCETLMRSRNHRDQYMSLMAETVGGEMEGCSLLNMIDWMEQERRPLGVIVIKGVSDYGDNKDNKRWQFTAAKAAVDFVHYCLEETVGMAEFNAGINKMKSSRQSRIIVFPPVKPVSVKASEPERPTSLTPSPEPLDLTSTKPLPLLTSKTTATHQTSKFKSESSGSETDEASRLQLPPLPVISTRHSTSGSDTSSVKNEDLEPNLSLHGTTAAQPTSSPQIKKTTPSPSPNLTRKSKIPVYQPRRSTSSLKSRTTSQESLVSTSGSLPSLKTKVKTSPRVSRKTNSKEDVKQKKSTNRGLRQEQVPLKESSQKPVSHQASNKPQRASVPKKQTAHSTLHSSSSPSTSAAASKVSSPRLTKRGKAEHESKVKSKPTSSHTTAATRSVKISSKKDGGANVKETQLLRDKQPLGEAQQDPHYSSQCPPPEPRTFDDKVTQSTATTSVTENSSSTDKTSHFPDKEISEDSVSELFEAVAKGVTKWQFLGRYLDLEDEVLEDINKNNHFRGEKCMKMLLKWKREYGSRATYLKLEEALKNILHEDLLEELEEFIPKTSSDNMSIASGREYPIQLTSEGLSETDLKRIKESFETSRNDGLETAKVSLSYLSGSSSEREEKLHHYSFCVDLCDDNCVCVLEDLCLCAAVYRNANCVTLLVVYS